VSQSQVDDTLRMLLRDLAKESAKPTIGRGRGQTRRSPRLLGFLRIMRRLFVKKAQ